MVSTNWNSQSDFVKMVPYLSYTCTLWIGLHDSRVIVFEICVLILGSLMAIWLFTQKAQTLTKKWLEITHLQAMTDLALHIISVIKIKEIAL